MLSLSLSLSLLFRKRSRTVTPPTPTHTRVLARAHTHTYSKTSHSYLCTILRTHTPTTSINSLQPHSLSPLHIHTNVIITHPDYKGRKPEC